MPKAKPKRRTGGLREKTKKLILRAPRTGAGIPHREFRRRAGRIEGERYQGDEEIARLFGLRRAEFEILKFGRLIRLAEACESKVFRHKHAVWKRGLANAKKQREKFGILLNAVRCEDHLLLPIDLRA